MYIVPYFLKNEAKNLLKIKLSKIIENISNDLIDNIFNPTFNNKYQNIVLNLDYKIKQSVLDIIKETIEIFDKLYVTSDNRKKYFNISNPKCHRVIITIFGILEFDRIYYYSKEDKNKHFYFIDSLFNFPSYDRYDSIVKGLAIDNAISTNQKKGAELTNKQINSLSSYLNDNSSSSISRQDIYRWIDKWNIPKIEYESIVTDDETLYIMIDEKYIHEQLKSITNNEVNNKIESKSSSNIKFDYADFVNKILNPPLLLPAPKNKSKHFIMSKAFITFTNIKSENNRRRLINKTTFLTTSRNPWDEFMDFISKIYDFNHFKTIKVLSDAGSWILAGIPNLKLFLSNVVVPCLCEFHVRQKVNRITKDENLRKILNNSIDNNDKSTFIKTVNNIIKEKDKKRQDIIKKYKHYIIVHWDAIFNMKSSNFKSSMESHISHNVAKFFSFEPKAFSVKHIQKLIKLQEYKANGINIFSLFLKSFNNTENITLKKEELSFSIFDNSSSNIPILYNSNSFTRSILSSIAFS